MCEITIRAIAASIFAEIVQNVVQQHPGGEHASNTFFAMMDLEKTCNRIGHCPPGETFGDFTIVSDDNLNPDDDHVHARCFAHAIFKDACSAARGMKWECAEIMNRTQLTIYLLTFMHTDSIDCHHSEPLEPYESGEQLITIYSGPGVTEETIAHDTDSTATQSAATQSAVQSTKTTNG